MPFLYYLRAGPRSNDAITATPTANEPKANSGMGVLLTDKDHNLPAKSGQRFDVPIDWRGTYLEGWGVS